MWTVRLHGARERGGEGIRIPVSPRQRNEGPGARAIPCNRTKGADNSVPSDKHRHGVVAAPAATAGKEASCGSEGIGACAGREKEHALEPSAKDNGRLDRREARSLRAFHGDTCDHVHIVSGGGIIDALDYLTTNANQNKRTYILASPRYGRHIEGTANRPERSSKQIGGRSVDCRPHAARAPGSIGPCREEDHRGLGGTGAPGRE